MMKRGVLLGCVVAMTLAVFSYGVPVRAQDDEGSTCNPAKADADSGSATFTLESGGLERSYIVYVPEDYDSAQAVPLVIALHGYTSSGAVLEGYSGWNDVADREGVLVVYPQGTGNPTFWAAYGADQLFNPDGVDDVQFMRDLLDALQSDYCVEATRIYVNGMSNGGGMAYRVGCELSDQIAAVGTVAAAVFRGTTCAPSQPVPLMAFHGTADSVVAYDGGRLFEPVATWTADWADANGCAAEPETIEASGNVSGVRYVDCDADAEVIVYTIDAGGHTWPGSTPRVERVLGDTTQDIDATEAMWDFFEGYALADDGE